VYFGILSVRKGIPYLLEATKHFHSNELELHLIGSVDKSLEPVLSKYSHPIFHAPRPQKDLVPLLQEMDCFCFPTLEDGFGQTLPQALAVGLYLMVTANCGAEKQLRGEEEGKLVSIQNAKAIEEELRWVVENRERVSGEREQRIAASNRFSWENYSNQLNQIIGPAVSADEHPVSPHHCEPS
jgi:alpha-maltose-1-phosphate synthase